MTAEDGLGWLTTLIAEEAEWDRRSLWQLGSWAAGSVGALVLAFLAVHSSSGLRREQIAAADFARQAEQIQALGQQGQTETRRLSSAINTLNGDRDRLYARVTVLEQGLDSVTGAVIKPSIPPSLVMSSSSQPIFLPPPVIAAVATTTAAVAEPTPAPQPAAVIPIAVAAPAAKEALPSATVYAPPDPGAPRLVEAKPPSDVKPLPPVPQTAQVKTDAKSDKPAVVAATQPTTETAPEIAIQHTDFGVDLGGANSIDGLRALWQGLIKADTALLGSLRPIVVIRERSNGLGLQLRLVAGPLSDAATAAKICAALAENDRSCETAVFDGQRLSMKPERDETPAAAPKLTHPTRPPARHSWRHEAPPAPTPQPQPAPQASAQPSLLPGFLRGR